jgi:hypothetical protein
MLKWPAVPARAGRRGRRAQAGQDLIEYAGMLVLVAAVFVALWQLGIPGHVKDVVDSAVHTVLGSGGGSSATHTGAARH